MKTEKRRKVSGNRKTEKARGGGSRQGRYEEEGEGKGEGMRKKETGRHEEEGEGKS